MGLYYYLLFNHWVTAILVQEPFPPQAGAMEIVTVAGNVLTQLQIALSRVENLLGI